MGEVFKRQGSEYNSIEEYVNVFSPPPDEEEDHGHLDVSREQELSNSQNVSELLHNERDDLVMEESQNTQNESDNFASSQSSDTSNTTSGYGSQESMDQACEVDIAEMGQDLQCMETDNSTNGESGDVLYVSAEGKDWYMNFIKKIEYRLNLRENERIKSINDVLLDRHDMRQNWQELFDKEERSLTVIIERKTFSESGDIEADNESYEECLEVRFVYDWCKGDSLLKILHHKIVRPEPDFRDINFKSSSPCKIRSVNLSGKFLTCRNDKLTLAPIENESDNTSLFREYRFSALQSIHGKWTGIQLRTFQSLSENKYISAKLFNDVKLQEYTGAFSTTKPDNRFFKLIKSRQGYYFLESVTNPGTYLCWIKNKIELKIFYPGEMTDVESNHSEEDICLGN